MRFLRAALGALLAFGCAPDTQVAQDRLAPQAAGLKDDAGLPRSPRVLLYTKETEWFHPSNGVGAAVLLSRGRARGWEVTESKESTIFTDASLARFDVVVFVVTSGMTMSPKERDAFATYIAQGHGWVGAHSASHTDYDWTFMHEVVGANFCCHPPIMPANVIVEAPTDPIVAHVPRVWRHTDEWYTYDRRPENNPRIKVLLTLDELSARPDYPGPDMSPVLRVGYHATTWKQQLGATRSFFTGLGHTEESWHDEIFVSMMLKAIEWASLASVNAPAL